MRKNPLLPLIALLLLALTACSFNLAGDITPPPGWHPTPVPPTADISTLYPALPPDPAAGQAIYTQICAACHGEHGMGDGPLASEQPSTPAALAATDELREAVPAQHFLTITDGIPDAGMPPFGNKLSTRQRWDVLAYIYTLGTPQETIARGEELYQQRCTACHGSKGEGKDLVSQQRLAQKSDADLFASILGPQHPQETVEGLTEDDRWALMAYIRSLSFAQPSAAEEATPTATASAASPTPAEAPEEATPAPSATPAAEEGLLTITGQVSNGTAGGELPPNLEITLHGYDTTADNDVAEAFSATTTADAQGQFAFHDVPNAPHRIFVATTEYKDVLYGSRSVVLKPEETSVELPITIYETTTDHDNLNIDRLHVLVSLLDEQTLRVIELYVISNTGDKTVVGETPESPALTFALPPNAMHLQFQDGILGGRYVATEDGFGDRVPIYPQSTVQEVFAYELPIEGKKTTVSHPVPLDVTAAVLMVPNDVLTLQGDQVSDSGTDNDTEGNIYHVYQVDALPRDASLTYTVVRASQGLDFDNKTSMAIGLMALGAALIAVAVVLTHKERKAPAAADEAALPAAAAPDEDDPEMLMDAILTLDDLYQEGKISEEAYQRRRAALKARLKAVLDEEA